MLNKANANDAGKFPALSDEGWGFCNVELRDAGTNAIIATDTVTDTDCWKGGRSWSNEANTFEIKGRMEPASVFFTHMIGDRTGVLHIGTNQEMDLTRPSIDLPFSTWVYDGAVLELAPVTVIHGVYMQVSGRIGNVKDLTIHHGGELWGNAGGRTKGALNGSTYEFDRLMLQDRSKFHMEVQSLPILSQLCHSVSAVLFCLSCAILSNGCTTQYSSQCNSQCGSQYDLQYDS